MLELARPEDHGVVAALKRQVHSLHTSWRPDLFRMDEELYPKALFLEDIRDRRVYVARLGGMVVGYVRIAMRHRGGPGCVPEKQLLLEEICVEETLRSQGIGTDMVADVRALARAFGCGRMKISVYPQNDGAVAFYQRCGLRIDTITMQTEV